MAEPGDLRLPSRHMGTGDVLAGMRECRGRLAIDNRLGPAGQLLDTLNQAFADNLVGRAKARCTILRAPRCP